MRFQQAGFARSEKINLLTLLPKTFKAARLSEAAITGPPPREAMCMSPAMTNWASWVALGMK